MRKIGIYFLLIYLFTVFTAAQNFIILSSSSSKKTLLHKKGKYQQIMSESKLLQQLEADEKFKPEILKLNNAYILKVGPFFNAETLTLTYLGLRHVFPHSFIEEKPKILQPKVKYIKQEMLVEKEDQTLWTALFGLAIIGILYMFLSSDQIKNLIKQHHTIQKRQTDIEKKQSLLLEKMGEKIQTVALKNINSEKKLLETKLDKIDKKEIQTHIGKMKKHDEDLLQTTYQMIDFLKIKSGNIVIKQEAFQLSNVLHKLTNAVAPLLKSKGHTLQYDIAHNVTRYLVGDTVRTFQVLHNLLSEILAYKKKSDVTLKISIRGDEQLVFSIEHPQHYLTQEEIETLFIPSSWEEVQDENKEFGFFVLRELVANMEGTFLIESDKKRGTYYEFALPYIHDVENKSKKEELKKFLLSQKALVVDSNEEKVKIFVEILLSFGIEVIFQTSESLALHKPDLTEVDFFIIKAEDISKKVLTFFKDMDGAYSTNILVIHSIYDVNNRIEITSYVADIELYSPLIIGDVEEALKQLCMNKEKKKKDIIREELKNFKILDVAKVSRRDFYNFTTKKILIVEDNLVSQQVLNSILSVSQMEIYKVENGIQALYFLEEHEQIDLIFMDMNMPVMDGFEATKKIRQHYRYKDIPIVAVTGLGFNYEMEQMVLSGVDACIIKPFKVGQLYVALQRFLKLEAPNEVTFESKTAAYDTKQNILDISKGIYYVHSESFYKEIVAQVLIALKNSDTLVKKMILDDDIDALRAFCIDALGLTATIGATSFVMLLNTILHKIAQKEEVLLSKYMPLYKEEWLVLEEEMKRYLKQ